MNKKRRKEEYAAKVFQRAPAGVRRACAEAAEHGLGAGIPIGRLPRGTPVTA